MDPIERLSSLFEKFPGIGPRQAQRFVQFLLRNSTSGRRKLIDALENLGGAVHQCPECMRFHAGNKKICNMCTNSERNDSQLAVVASDADLGALERSGTYRGRYFVLGGTISLASEKMSGLRIKELNMRINDLRNRYEKFGEVILAFPANPEGDATEIRLREELEQGEPLLKVTSLGRGLSTGSELEYADPETIKSALEGRR